MLGQSVLLGALALIVVYLGQSVLRTWRQRDTARRLGCKPPNQYRHTRPWGMDLYRLRLEAVKEGRYNRLFLDHFDQYGHTFEEQTWGGGRVINTTATPNYQAVAATNFEDYARPPKRSKAMEPFMGRGILSTNGSAWRHSRDMIKPLFKRAELSDVDSFKIHVDRLFARIPRDGSTMDMQPLLQKLFLDSSTEFIFGESIGSLLDSSRAADDFNDAFNQSLLGAGKRGLLAGGNLGILFMFDKTWERNYSKIHAYVDRHVARSLAALESSGSNELVDQRPRQRYVLIDEMAKQIKDPIALRSQLIQIFFPGRDATAIAVSNTLFFLARNPKIWAELRHQALALGGQPLTFEVLKSLQYFRYTLFEGIRLQGPSGRTQRVAVRDTVLPCGGGRDGSFPLFVPEGTTVALNNFPKHHDPEIWGEDVDAFRPDRFNGKILSWEFTPFFGGPRICPANQQVIVQGVYLLVRLVKEFKTIENRDECFEYVERIRMLCESRNGVKIALHSA